ncbi:hypothetical protein BDZ91DRAFT_851920 [Kalaharituber pfeilii]|nr:hypothetical protein BDZ91DRAFT_851920 [Kalaharituber pfeilii]
MSSFSKPSFSYELDDEDAIEELSPTGGIRAFYGGESSSLDLFSFESKSHSSSTVSPASMTASTNQTGAPRPNQAAAYQLHKAPASAAIDTLEFFEFISKNGVRIIPFDELEMDPKAARAIADDGALLEGANMKIIRGKWHTEDRPYGYRSHSGPIAVALKVFKKAPVGAAVTGAAAAGSALDDVRAREAAAEYKRLMNDILYEIQIMHQAGANQHSNVAELYGLSFEAGNDDVADSSRDTELSVQRYLRPILVSPLAHVDYPDLRHFLAHNGPSRPRPLPWNIASKLIGDIGEGLHALHHVNVVHADVKPENILIYPDRFPSSSSQVPIVARVADFGFSGFKDVSEMTPRGGTRAWNAPECLRGWEDVHARWKRSCQETSASFLNVEAGEWSTKVTRDVYSFGLVMVHILLDGAEPLPFRDLQELDRLKFADEAADLAKHRLKATYTERRMKGARSGDEADDEEWNEEIFERLEKLVDTTLRLYPWERRQSLNAIRSYLAGRYIYSRDLDMMRMITAHRFPTLASATFSDLLHQVAASTPAIQLSFRSLPRAIKHSIFQHYTTQGLHTLAFIQKMRLQGLCAQEIRDAQKPIPVPNDDEASESSQRVDRVTEAQLEILKEVETKLLADYEAFRDVGSTIRKYLERVVTYDDSALASNAELPNILRHLQQGHVLDTEMILRSKEFILPDLTLWTKKSSLGGLFHYAVYLNRADIIPPLLNAGMPGLDEGAGQLGLTALHVAAMRGNLNVLQELMSGGALTECRSMGALGYITPLELAVGWCSDDNAVDVVQVLLSAATTRLDDNSTKLVARVGCKTTLLHMAAARKSSAVLTSLLARHINPGLLDTRDVYYRTPLHVAALAARLDCVKLLLSKGADPGLRDYQGMTAHELVKECSLSPEKGLDWLGSDVLYNILTNGRDREPLSTEYQTLLHEFTTIAAQSTVSTDFSDDITNRLPFQTATNLAKYQSPEKSFQHDRPAFASTSDDWTYMTDYFTAATPDGHFPCTQNYPRKYAYLNTATSIPRETDVLYFSDAMPQASTQMGPGAYLLMRPRYGLRFIYHIVHKVEPATYQIVIRLGRIKHTLGWNDFPMVLEVKSLPSKEVLVSQVWRTSACLPLENHLYTVKFTEFELLEMADIEISLSTIEIGSKTSPSAFLALNWLALEPGLPHIPHYAILVATDATVELPEWRLSNNGDLMRIGYVAAEYSGADEVNFQQIQETRYHTLYDEGREFQEDSGLHNWDKRGLWKIMEKGQNSNIQGQDIGFGRQIVPNFDWTRMIG